MPKRPVLPLVRSASQTPGPWLIIPLYGGFAHRNDNLISLKMTTMQFRPCTFHSYKMQISESSPSALVDDRSSTNPNVIPGLLGALLAEELEWRVLGLDRLVTLGLAILTTLSFVSENGVENHVPSTLNRNVTAKSVV